MFLLSSFTLFLCIVPSRVDRAVTRVYRLALQGFTNPCLVSSCAAFIEMLDRDSCLLRIDVQAANRIARYGTISSSTTDKNREKKDALHNTKIG